MYVKYFNFNGKPFSINPDPRFFFNSKTHKQGLLSLRHGLEKGQEFVVVTGDSGTGKSTLRSAFQHLLAKNNIVTATMVNTFLGQGEMFLFVAAELGLPYEGLTEEDLLKSIESFLNDCQSKQKSVVIIVDEAQNLSDSSIDELKMIMSLISDKESLHQIVLFGQTHLREGIYGKLFGTPFSRGVTTHHLENFDQKETKAYVTHRLRTVGWIGDPERSA